LSNSLLTLHGRDFLSISDLDHQELLAILDLADQIKSGSWHEQPLAGRHVAMLFQKPSMRTRVSFEVGIHRLGGACVALGEQDVQIGYRETVGDAARVLDRYVDLIVARLRRHEDLLELAAAARVPVVNALTELEHPCQVLADLMTIREHCGSLDVPVCFVGDGNNMVTSLAQAQQLVGFPFTVVTPPGFEPPESVRAATPAMVVSNERTSVAGARVVYTDVWTSMGFEVEAGRRRAAFYGYQVDAALLQQAPDAIFMHCLPAHRGEEVSDEVLDGPSSVVFDQAENRLHVQMALLALLA
jgi:ornithine carbamoyltransferase